MRALRKVARPGAPFARRRWVALFAMPLWCRRVSAARFGPAGRPKALMLRRPPRGLRWLGHVRRGHGFLEGARRALLDAAVTVGMTAVGGQRSAERPISIVVHA
jgi:hypothetical protein